MGDDNQTLTQRMWQEGKNRLEKEESLEWWKGICQGWAAASYMMERPTSKVNVIAADGKTLIPFYPADIKALASLLWAQQKEMIDENFIGGRCNKDLYGETGRIESQDCWDTNPGTWHMAVVNQIGVSRRSFIMDVDQNLEVWNHPVYSYEYFYFNPERSFETSGHAQDVAIDISHYTSDDFKSYRDEKAKWIVGVSMRVELIRMKRPNHWPKDSEAYDSDRRPLPNVRSRTR